ARYHGGAWVIKKNRQEKTSGRARVERLLVLQPGAPRRLVRLAALMGLGDLAWNLLQAGEVELDGELQESEVPRRELLAVAGEEVGGEDDVVARKAPPVVVVGLDLVRRRRVGEDLPVLDVPAFALLLAGAQHLWIV